MNQTTVWQNSKLVNQEVVQSSVYAKTIAVDDSNTTEENAYIADYAIFVATDRQIADDCLIANNFSIFNHLKPLGDDSEDSISENTTNLDIPGSSNPQTQPPPDPILPYSVSTFQIVRRTPFPIHRLVLHPYERKHKSTTIYAMEVAFMPHPQTDYQIYIPTICNGLGQPQSFNFHVPPFYAKLSGTKGRKMRCYLLPESSPFSSEIAKTKASLQQVASSISSHIDTSHKVKKIIKIKRKKNRSLDQTKVTESTTSNHQSSSNLVPIGTNDQRPEPMVVTTENEQNQNRELRNILDREEQEHDKPMKHKPVKPIPKRLSFTWPTIPTQPTIPLYPTNQAQSTISAQPTIPLYSTNQSTISTQPSFSTVPTIQPYPAPPTYLTFPQYPSIPPFPINTPYPTYLPFPPFRTYPASTFYDNNVRLDASTPDKIHV